MADDWRRRATPAVIRYAPEVDASDYERPAAPKWGTWVLKLPLPPSTNDLLRPAPLRGKRGKPVARMVATKEAKEYRALAVPLILEQVHRSPGRRIVGVPAYLTLVCYFRSIASDCTNRAKAVEDAITAAKVVWADDCQVVHHEADKDLCAIGEQEWCEVRVGAYHHHNGELRARLAMSTKAGGGR